MQILLVVVQATEHRLARCRVEARLPFPHFPTLVPPGSRIYNIIKFLSIMKLRLWLKYLYITFKHASIDILWYCIRFYIMIMLQTIASHTEVQYNMAWSIYSIIRYSKRKCTALWVICVFNITTRRLMNAHNDCMTRLLTFSTSTHVYISYK